jgi:hypothetical protein
MNPKLLFILFFPVFLHAQAKLKFDTTVYDYGRITEGSDMNREFKFKNVGTEPLVVERASTGDGGSFADYPREPIAPGKTGVIVFHYDSKRIGPFGRSIYVSYNSSWGNAILYVKGEVVFKQTKVTACDSTKNIGNVKFGELDTVEFSFINSGKEPLHISFDYYNYPEADMIWLKMEPTNSSDQYPYSNGYAPNEKLHVKVLLKNVYGNTGPFQRKLLFFYNSHDSIMFQINGNYVGNPPQQKVVEGGDYYSYVFHYEKNFLAKKEKYSSNGILLEEEFYLGSYCTQKKTYQGFKCQLSREQFYHEGKMTEQKIYTNEGY